jgi:3-deoxy-D-manno-octulosonic acid (KDO) 8-phosphate synthase
MSAGIVRVHGSPTTGTSLNVTGRKGMFIGGYQPLFVKIQTVTSTYGFTTGYNTAEDGSTSMDTAWDRFIRACETVGTVVGYSTPVTDNTYGGASSSSTVTVLFDAGSVNQGDGAGGQSGVTTGFGALKTALAAAGSVATTDIAVTVYTGLTGAALSA